MSAKNSIEIPPAATTPPRPKLTTAQACAMLVVSKPKFQELRERPGFPRPFRYSSTGRLLWDEQELLAWLETQRVDGGPTDAA